MDPLYGGTTLVDPSSVNTPSVPLNWGDRQERRAIGCAVLLDQSSKGTKWICKRRSHPIAIEYFK